jgi:subtilisin family serine protease
LACAIALLCAIGLSAPGAAHAEGIIVSRDPGLSAGQRAEVRADAGVALERSLPVRDTELVSAPAGRADEALAALNADPDVRFAVPDVTVTTQSASDPWSFQQWYLDQPSDRDIDASAAWENSSQGDTVTVAVVDERVDTSHEDLQGSIDGVQQNFVTGDTCTLDPPLQGEDHGTMMAGIIAAQRDNGLGVTGVAPLAKVLPLRAINNCGRGTLSWVVAAFDYAGRNGVPIVSASFATDPLMSPAYRADVNKLMADLLETYPDTLFVVPSGNEGADIDAENLPVYPCSTTLADGADPANLVCVGMTDRGDIPSCWGNVGAKSVDLFAPGMGIWTTASPDSYFAGFGTSMAVPIVAGAAAVLKSNAPDEYPASELKRLLVGRGFDFYDGMAPWSVAGGRLNMNRLLSDRGGGASGGGSWHTCDTDHDATVDGADDCGTTPGLATLRGCPDADSDGLRDIDDNCPSHANRDQADTDGDHVGDACDPTPRGDDGDGDGRARLDDACPNTYGTAANGCPVQQPPDTGGPPPVQQPTVTPRSTPAPPPPPPAAKAEIVSLRAKLSPRKCPKSKRHCTKVAKVTVKLSQRARVAMKIEKRVRSKRSRRWVWRRASSKSLVATARGSSLTVRGKRGKRATKYRVTATLAGHSEAVRFSV